MKSKQRQGLFARLSKSRKFLVDGIESVLKKGTEISDDELDNIGDQLILSDLGVEVSDSIINHLRTEIRKRQISTVDEVRQVVRDKIVEILEPVSVYSPNLYSNGTKVLVVVGVNGVGKTTTVAKLAYWSICRGQRVMLAACDTFRAAAIDQLNVWSQRLDVPIVAQERGTDAAAVAHDALESARARKIDLLIIDTAGRQHSNVDLMQQLKKISRVLSHLDVNAPHETFLVVDAGNGQNVLTQVESFHAVVPLTGICVTKLDGTARGGIIVALARQFGIPIPFVATGEKLEDLAKFDAREFASALLPE